MPQLFCLLSIGSSVGTQVQQVIRVELLHYEYPYVRSTLPIGITFAVYERPMLQEAQKCLCLSKNKKNCKLTYLKFIFIRLHYHKIPYSRYLLFQLQQFTKRTLVTHYSVDVSRELIECLEVLVNIPVSAALNCGSFHTNRINIEELWLPTILTYVVRTRVLQLASTCIR